MQAIHPTEWKPISIGKKLTPPTMQEVQPSSKPTTPEPPAAAAASQTVEEDDVKWLDAMRKMAEQEEQVAHSAYLYANKKQVEMMTKVQKAEADLKALLKDVAAHTASVKQLHTVYIMKRVARDKLTKLWGIHKQCKA